MTPCDWCNNLRYDIVGQCGYCHLGEMLGYGCDYYSPFVGFAGEHLSLKAMEEVYDGCPFVEIASILLREAQMPTNVYVYHREIFMHNHRYSDEVALTTATDLESAIEAFQTTYEFASERNVRKVAFDRLVNII